MHAFIRSKPGLAAIASGLVALGLLTGLVLACQESVRSGERMRAEQRGA